MDQLAQREQELETPPAASSETTMWLLPSPSFTFRPGDSNASDEWGMHCFPLGYRKVICVDQSGLAFAFDAEKRIFSAMRGLLPKFTCVDIEAPGRRGIHSGDSSLFVMERFPEPEATNSGQFEGFFNDRTLRFFSWAQRLFPQPPPFVVRKGGRSSTNSSRSGPGEITAYTMVGRGRGSRVCVRKFGDGTVPKWGWGDGTYIFDDGSCICVSAAGAGTYCMDMHRPKHAAWKWTQVGEWMLPFHGKVEYVPELKLWFGFSADSRCLAAADLSGMRTLSQNQERPQLVGTWEELDPPKEWRECRDPQLVSLGSGRFCIARFFKTASGSPSESGDGETGEDDFTVLTGVEMVPDDSGNGKVMKLRMIRHMSRRLHGGGTIDTVF